jgi:hypothetical protein
MTFEQTEHLSVMQLLSRIQARRNNSIYRHGDGEGEYAEMVERIMNEKRAAESYRKSLEESRAEREKKKAQEIASKTQELVYKAKKIRQAHPEDFRPAYWGNSSG